MMLDKISNLSAALLFVAVVFSIPFALGPNGNQLLKEIIGYAMLGWFVIFFPIAVWSYLFGKDDK
jgi:hypothetical protein